MAIYKKDKIWYIDFYVDGKRKREAIGPNRKMAERVLAKRKVQVAENRYLDIQKQSKVTFEHLAAQYMDYARVNKRSWERDQRSIRVLMGWFQGKFLFEVSPLMIEKFKSSRRKSVSPASVNRELACLKHMFTKAIEWDMIASNPVKQVKLFRESTGRVRYLTMDEIHLLIKESAEHLRPIIIIAIYTGMRKSEILNLKWEDVDFESKMIYVSVAKSGYGREIPMAEPVLFALRGLRSKSDSVFNHEKGTPIKNFRTAFTNAVRRARIDNFTFHDLRHTFASHLVMNGVDLLTVKELLGHRSINMTLRYAHLSPEHKKKAVASLKYFGGHYMDTLKGTAKGADA